MAHVGIERFAAGHRQKHAAKNQKRQSRLFDKHAKAIDRIEGVEYFEIIADVNQPHEANDGKPQGCHGRKNRGNAGGAAVLEQEQAEEHGKGERHHHEFKPGIDNGKAFNGREHRHGGRDHRVAKEKCRANDAKRQHHAALFLQQRFDKHDERENAAFALVVGAHEKDDVFQPDDQDQGPEQERDNAEDRKAQVAAGIDHRVQGLAHGVKRACADVAKDHANGGESQFVLGRRGA